MTFTGREDDKVAMSNRERLLQLFKERAVLREGRGIDVGTGRPCCFDTRLLTLSPDGAHLIGLIMFSLFEEARIDAVGGMTVGANPIATAIALVSHMQGKPIPAFLVRGRLGEDDARRQIEGPLAAGARVGIVDDVIATGRSVLQAIDVVEAAGCSVGKVVVLLDRCEGGADEVRRRGYEFAALLTAGGAEQMRLWQ
jgi:orotate phosphoribosyltransferase